MNTQQIKTYWMDQDTKLSSYKPFQLSNSRLLKSTIDFLVDCGLPDSCAPCLSFDECYFMEIPTPNQVFDIDIAELNDYLWIGSNGSGDPVCIDLLNNNEIVYLNHDNDFERVFMNSNVITLSKCLMVYSNFIEKINATNVSNWLDRNYSDEVVEQLKQELSEVDPRCIEENTMWSMELYDL